MDEQQQEEQPQNKSRALQIKTFLVGLTATEVIDLIAHGGWPGAAFAAGAAAILAVKSPEIVAPFREMLPPVPTWGGRSLIDRALGRYPDEPHNDDPHNTEGEAPPDYQTYIQSPEWKARAKYIRARDNYTCQDCGATNVSLDVHHLTYARLGHEDDADLLTLCRACHDARHGKVVDDEPMEALQPKSASEPVLSRPHLASPAAALRAPSQRAFFTLSDVLASGFRPSLQRIYLATLEDGTEVYVPATKLCHVALAGLTRGGKGHLKRSLMAQLCAVGAEVYLLDPHYTRWDRESEDPTGKPCPEDWTPYSAYLHNDPAEQIPVKQKYQVIAHYLLEAKQELDRRLERYGRSLSVGRPMYLFIDELPAIVDNVPEAPAYLKSLLREGAKVGVYVVAMSQDFLVKTLFPNEGGAVRDCFRTVLYVGGDAQTARILLDMPAKDVPENRLGKGRVMLRCDAVRPAQEARVPYVDNQALYALLGPSTYEPDEEEDELIAALVGPQLKPAYQADEPETEKLPTRYASGQRTIRSADERRQAREQRLRGGQVAAREREQTVPHDAELARGIRAYQSGAKTIDDFQAAMGLQTQHQARVRLARVKMALREDR